jgi:predicted TIM-barrel fold metal-dependent hydrolase
VSVPIIDLHTHLAGVGHGGTGCFIAPRKFDSLYFRGMCWLLGISGADRRQRFDQAYLARLDQHVQQAVENNALDAIVVYAHDRVYNDSGQAPDAAQELFVPNEYAFACAERDGMRGRYLPAMSVHPYRPDALEETAKWIERGAVAMKWLPNSQGMDPSDKRCFPIYELLARKHIPLIVHTAGEHTVTVIRPDLGSPLPLREALGRGVTVVLAHSGTHSGFFDHDWSADFRELVTRYPHCYGDCSAFCTPGRTRWITRFARDEQILNNLIHGSDFPVPPSAFSSVFTLGLNQAWRISRLKSFLQRDIAIKRACQFPDSVFTRAAEVLGQSALERWRVLYRRPPACTT